jgi:hypothetical protein
MAAGDRPESTKVNDTARSIRGLLGSLVAVPLVAICFGSQWSWNERIEPATARITRGGYIRVTHEEPLRWRSEGTAAEHAAPLPRNTSAEVELPRPLAEFSIELQAERNRSYQVFAARAGGGFDLIWTAVGAPEAGGLTTGRSPPLRLAAPAQRLRIGPLDRREATAISAIRLIAPRWSLSHLVLVPLPWAVWCALWLAGRRSGAAPAARNALAGWQRADLWIAAAAIYAILFRVAAPGMAGALAACAITAAVFALRRAPIPTASVLATVAICAVLIPRVLAAVVVSMVSEQFDLTTIDHRPKPDGENINSDGIRFRGEAEDVKREDFVVLFLGDSFTFGTRLHDRATYPHAFEKFVNSHACGATVRAINFGWPSASPLLGHRLLRQIGYKYKPDLVVYSLDMTDFHDDLHYERALRSAGELEVDSTRLLRQFVERKTPRLSAILSGGYGLRRLFRPGRPREVGGEPELPTDRFFATALPLGETRAWIEAGVMKHLSAIHAFATGALEAPMVLLIYPRAYQYSEHESPQNWEHRSYEILGPFVREPFRYFEAAAKRLPYPVVNLLPAFETATTFPLYLEDDPHWNRDGARVAATAAAREVGKLGLIPCEIP